MAQTSRINVLKTRIQQITLVCLILLLTACSEYLPIAGGELKGSVSALPVDWSELASVKIIQLESMGAKPYSVNLWITEVGGAPHVFAGDNRTEWVENIATNPNVRLKVRDRIFELRATRVEDIGVFEVFAQQWKSKYGNRPQNENVAETYLFRLDPRGEH